MRNTYAVEVPLSASPEPEQVARLWHSWITDRKNAPRLPQALRDSPATDLLSTEIGPEQTLEQIRVDSDGPLHFALRWEHPDNETHGVRWRTELAYVSAHGDQRARFSCKLAVGRSTVRIAPTRRQTTRPKIVLAMLKKFPGVEGEPITTSPITLRLTDAGRFAKFLTADDRRRPVVLVTCRNFDDRPTVDPRRTSDLLAGLAFVYVAEGRWPTLALRDHLPQHLVCRDGAVRIYWPGFVSEGNGHEHPFWTATDIRYMETETEGGLAQLLLENVVEAAVYTAGAHQADWHRFESVRRRAQISESRAAGDFEKLAESYAGENDSLRQKADTFEEDLRAASDALRQSRNEVKYWRGMYDDAKANDGQAGQATVDDIGSVADALDKAVARSNGRLVESLNAASDRDTPFAAPEDLFESLCFLATTYYDSKSGTTPCPDLDLALRERTGWTYEAHQSQTTMGKHRSEYECTWDVRRYPLKAHMGTGSSKDPRHTIRVAFAWDDKKKVVVIGYVGQHQSNDRTS